MHYKYIMCSAKEHVSASSLEKEPNQIRDQCKLENIKKLFHSVDDDQCGRLLDLSIREILTQSFGMLNNQLTQFLIWAALIGHFIHRRIYPYTVQS